MLSSKVFILFSKVLVLCAIQTVLRGFAHVLVYKFPTIVTITPRMSNIYIYV